jgi:hypothetical protein
MDSSPDGHKTPRVQPIIQITRSQVEDTRGQGEDTRTDLLQDA